MSETASPSTFRPYGLLRVAQAWGVSWATVYPPAPAWRPAPETTAGAERRPAGR